MLGSLAPLGEFYLGDELMGERETDRHALYGADSRVRCDHVVFVYVGMGFTGRGDRDDLGAFCIACSVVNIT